MSRLRPSGGAAANGAKSASPIRWIAWRIRREIVHDRRTLAFYLAAPIVVMTLVYVALMPSGGSKVGLLARGPSRLFVGDIENALIRNEAIQVLPTGIDDNENDPREIETQIHDALAQKRLDAVVFLEENLLRDRFEGARGELKLYVEGSRPMTTADVLKAVSDAMDDLNMAMPVVADPTCDPDCLESFNPLPIHLQRIYLHGDDDTDSVDFFLPMFPAFFVFFFTFITSAITFQRERKSGTLERLAAAPLSLRSIVLGYLLGFLPFATVQAVIVLTFIFKLIGLTLTANAVTALVLATVLGLAMGLLFGIAVSFLARNEFQVMQTIPVIVLPQVFLSDMIWDISNFPLVFQWLAQAFPLTYLNQFVRATVIRGEPVLHLWVPLAASAAFLLLPIVVLGKRGLSGSAGLEE